MINRRSWLRSLPALLLLQRSGLASGASADAYRLLSGNLRLYASSPPGGAVDLIARSLANDAAQVAGVNLTVLNVDGANGEIALSRFAAEPPDGKSWLVAHDSAIVINPSFYPRRSADVLDRLHPVAGLATNSFYLLVRAEDPIRSFDDLLREASRPESPVTYGSGGVGSYHHLLMEDLAARRALTLIHVPYRGNSFAVQGLVRGDVRLLMAGASALPLVRAGKLRIVAVTAPKRVPLFAEVPALAEYIPDFQGTAWFALFAAAGTPPSAIGEMTALAREIVESAAFVGRLRDAGNVRAEYVDAATLTQRIHADRRRFADLIARLPAAAMKSPGTPN